MSTVGPQRSDARSLHLHRAVVAKLRGHPERRLPCLALVNRWLAAPELQASRPYFERWRALLENASDDEFERVVLAPAEGQALRSCSPLGPVLTNHERWALLREARAEFDALMAMREREIPRP